MGGPMSKFKEYLEAIKLTKGDKDFFDMLSPYGSKKTIQAIINSKEIKDAWPEDLLHVVEALVKELKTPGSSLVGGDYSYTPNKTLTEWTSSDEGNVKGKILDIMVDYMDGANQTAIWLTTAPRYVIGKLIKVRKLNE
jgi:hypothetical protein